MPTSGAAAQSADARLDPDLASVARRVRRITVQVRGPGAATGSGVIWSARGIVVTNAHVARGPATVVLPGGERLGGRLIAWDPERDLAALSIDAGALPAAEVADSDAVRVGEIAVAVGHPFGLTGAMTAGVIHAIAPRREGGRARFIQADLSLAPGNSGGPLADARGHVIGVNTMIAGGLALAVPSNTVVRFLAALRDRAAAPP